MNEVLTISRYLFGLTLAVDANFRLKSRMRAQETLGLMTGAAYFVDEAPYKQYLAETVVQDQVRSFIYVIHVSNHVLISIHQVSTCTSLLAVTQANTRGSSALRASGVGASVCARHGFFRPNGIGDLQKGEK